MRRLRGPLLAVIVRCVLVGAVAVAVTVSAACAGRRNPTGDLMAPKDARPWESKFGRAFDDGYTKEVVKLSGRAPNDVLDQRLFAARLGHADVVALAEVTQVWGRGRYQGKQDQFLEVELGEVLLGDLPKGTEPIQTLGVASEDELPGALRGQTMVLFVRWAPDDAPSYHHHLMPAQDEAVAHIRALVQHAQDAGMIDARGKARKRPRRNRRRKADAAASTNDE
jgi:hypothetical protein